MSPNEREALLWVRELIPTLHFDPYDEKDPPSPDTRIFNMSMIFSSSECGTVGCIGGWMATHMQVNPDDYVNLDCSRELHDLFFPPAALDWDYITPDDAVRAIDNLLNTGTPNWEDICDVMYEDGENE